MNSSTFTSLLLVIFLFNMKLLLLLVVVSAVYGRDDSSDLTSFITEHDVFMFYLNDDRQLYDNHDYFNHMTFNFSENEISSGSIDLFLKEDLWIHGPRPVVKLSEDGKSAEFNFQVHKKAIFYNGTYERFLGNNVYKGHFTYGYSENTDIVIDVNGFYNRKAKELEYKTKLVSYTFEFNHKTDHIDCDDKPVCEHVEKITFESIKKSIADEYTVRVEKVLNDKKQKLLDSL